MRRALGMLCVVALGCGGQSAPYTLGAAGPWTEGYGAMGRRGIELALDSLNRAGGVRGQPLRVVFRDDEGNGEKAAKIAGEFVADEAILGVIGHLNSGAMVAAAKVYDGRLAAISPTASSPALTGVSPWVFRVISSDSVNGRDMARFASGAGYRRAAILYENNAYGRGLTQSFRRNFAGAIVSEDPIGEGDAQDFEPYMAWFRREQPDFVFVAGTEASGKAILRQARRQGVAAAFMGGDGWTGVVSEPASEGAFVGAPFSAADPRPEAQRFVAAFRARYGLAPDGNAALAYDATMLLAAAIESQGADRAGVRGWLSALGDGPGMAGVTGALRFGRDGDPVGKGFVMTRLRDGTFIVQGRSS